MKVPKQNKKAPISAPTVNDQPLVFGKINYLIMIIGVVLMVAGYLALTGGGSDDPNVFPADEIYSFRRITLAPLLVLAGLALQIPAILYKAED